MQTIAPTPFVAATGFRSMRAPAFVFSRDATWRNNCNRTRIAHLIEDLAPHTLEANHAIALDIIEKSAAKVLAERFVACGDMSFDDAMALYARLRVRETSVLANPALLDHHAAHGRPPSLQWLASLLALRKFTTSNQLGGWGSRDYVEPDALSTLHRRSALRRFLSAYVDRPLKTLNFGEMQRYNETHWLCDWVDWDRAAELAARPTQLLHAIFAQDKVQPPELDLETDDFQGLTPHQDFLYMAFAQALNRLKTGSTLHDFIGRRFAINQAGLRRAAHAALREDASEQLALDQIMGVNSAAPSNQIRHDGFSFLHAPNQTTQQVVRHWLDQAGLDSASAVTMTSLLERRLAALGESTAYPIGTPEQSMHSALLRIFAANAQKAPDAWTDLYRLGRDFIATVDQWAQHAIEYPMSPELLAALHLQSACGVTFEQIAAELNAPGAAAAQTVLDAPSGTHRFSCASDLDRAACVVAWLRLRSITRMDALLRDAGQLAVETALTHRTRRALVNRRLLPYREKSILDLGSQVVDFIPVIGPAKGMVHDALLDDVAGVAWNAGAFGIDLVLFGTPALARAMQAGKAISGRTDVLPSAYAMTVRAALKVADMFDSVHEAFAAEHAAAPSRVVPEIYGLDRNAPSGPIQYELEAIAASKATVRLPDHFIVALQGDNRIVRIERRGSHFLEVDMATGAPIVDADLIFRDPIDGTYYSRPDIPADPFLPPLIAGSAAFRKRITIVQVQRFINAHADYDRTSAAHALSRMFVFDNLHITMQRRIADHLLATLENSWDFVRLLNYARRRGETWTIVVEDSPLGPHTSFPTRQIVLLPLERTSSLPPYMSPRGATPATFEQILDHELMHALTGELDPERGLHGLTHRGGVSFLASRIAFDRGDIALPRVMYPHPLAPHLSEQVLVHENPAKMFVKAADQAAMEDRILDRQLNRARPPVSAAEIVFGTAIERRPAVKGFDSIDTIMRVYSANEGHLWEFGPGLTRFFDFGGSESERRTIESLFASIAEHGAMVGVSAHWAETFRPLNQRWTLTWRSAERSDGVPLNRLFVIDDEAREITFYSNQARYLSEIDIRPIEPHRQLLLALTSIFLPALAVDDSIVASGTGAYLSRTSLTTLVDDVLLQLDYRYPRQIARQLADASDEAVAHRLTENISDLRRAADKEDDYLSRRWVSESCQNGVSCGCTILRK